MSSSLVSFEDLKRGDCTIGQRPSTETPPLRNLALKRFFLSTEQQQKATAWKIMKIRSENEKKARKRN